jgi:hypothetical protein
MAKITGTKKVSHASFGRGARPGPAGQPHGSMGKDLSQVNNTDQKNLRVHGGMAGGPSPVKIPKTRPWNERG